MHTSQTSSVARHIVARIKIAKHRSAAYGKASAKVQNIVARHRVAVLRRQAKRYQCSTSI